jgi:hypothetical protein
LKLEIKLYSYNILKGIWFLSEDFIMKIRCILAW